jgi:hypothetical protein
MREKKLQDEVLIIFVIIIVLLFLLIVVIMVFIGCLNTLLSTCLPGNLSLYLSLIVSGIRLSQGKEIHPIP